MTPKTIVVTGATGAIMSEFIRRYPSEEPVIIIAVGRNLDKLAALRIATTEKKKVYACQADLTDLTDKRKGIFDSIDHVDILINAAACAPPTKTLTAFNEEMQWSVNVLSYLRMILRLHEKFDIKQRGCPPPIVLNIASQYGNNWDINLNDLQFVNRPYDSHAAYKQSKAIVRMMTYQLATSFYGQDHGILFNSMHPGGVPSQLTRDLNIGADDTPKEAAESIIYVLSEIEALQYQGRYFEYNRLMPYSWEVDEWIGKRLMDTILLD